jgi:hypothetical protein
MSNHKIVDVTTGEETLVDYTKKEMDEQKASQKAIDAKHEADIARATARAAVLERLGITAEEAALLLG